MMLPPPLLILFGFAAYGVLHSYLASKAAKDLARRVIGESATARVYRLFFNLVGVVTLYPILVITLTFPDQVLYTAPGFLKEIFSIVQIIGLLLVVISIEKTGLGDFLGTGQLFRGAEAPKLVTDGPYAWVRHPLYLGTMLVLWFNPSMTNNWAAFSLGASLYFIVGAIYEERSMEAFFGKEYHRYKAKTPMFVPRFKFKI
jgi:protein-S-isoprenylcysteine O-methyltransferase Ste14